MIFQIVQDLTIKTGVKNSPPAAQFSRPEALFAEQLPCADDEQEHAEAFAEQLHVQRRGQPRRQSGADKPRQDGGKERFFLDIAVFHVGGQGGGGGGQEVQQIDPLGQVLGDRREVGHIDQQQGAAADAEAGQHPGGRPGQQGDEPVRHSSALTPP